MNRIHSKALQSSAWYADRLQIHTELAMQQVFTHRNTSNTYWTAQIGNRSLIYTIYCSRVIPLDLSSFARQPLIKTKQISEWIIWFGFKSDLNINFTGPPVPRPDLARKILGHFFKFYFFYFLLLLFFIHIKWGGGIYPSS